jgi:hypothetical protein
MKWIIRIGVFWVMLVIGTLAGALERRYSIDSCVVDLSPDDHEYQRILAPAATGITVAYTGLVSARNGVPLLKFVITNGSPDPISYPAKGAEFPVPTLTSNGKHLPTPLGCGNGIKFYSIPPGASAEVYVYPDEFSKPPRSSDQVTASFNLFHEYDEELQPPPVSAPFILPAEFRTAIAH